MLSSHRIALKLVIKTWPTDTTIQEEEFLGIPFPTGVTRGVSRAYNKYVFVKYKRRCAYERVTNYLELPNNPTVNSRHFSRRNPQRIPYGNPQKTSASLRRAYTFIV